MVTHKPLSSLLTFCLLPSLIFLIVIPTCCYNSPIPKNNKQTNKSIHFSSIEDLDVFPITFLAALLLFLQLQAGVS